MGVSHRTFLMDGDKVKHLSKKLFNSFYLEGTASLPEFTGKTVTFASAIYSTAGRKPKQIMQIDVFRVRVADDGRIDKDERDQLLHLAANRLFLEEISATQQADTVVVDAQELFDERRWKQLTPDISGPALKFILANLFS